MTIPNFFIAVFQWLMIGLLVLVFAPIIIVLAKLDKGKMTRPMPAIWAFSWMVLFVTGVRVAVVGKERVQKGQNYLVCANHQGFMDMFALVHSVPLPLLFVSKASLFKIPLFGWGMRAVQHLELKRSDTEHDTRSLDQLVTFLREGRSYVMFPEGTRSPDGTIKEFKMGAFHSALKAPIPILPVSIIGSYDCLPKDSKRFYPGVVRLVIGEPVSPLGRTAEDLRDRVREEIVKNAELYGLPL
jgi:1-acyl-sn-glycerol-3-phosphate acyltransferase